MSTRARQHLLSPVDHEHTVRQARQPVVQRLMDQRSLSLPLLCHIAGRSPRAHDPAAVVAQRKLRRRDPKVRAVVEGLALDRVGHRLTRLHDTLFVLSGGGRVRRAEDVRVRLAHELIRSATATQRRHEAGADKHEPAFAILEEHALGWIRHEVAHAQTRPLLFRGAVRHRCARLAGHQSPSWLDPLFIGNSALRLIRANPQTPRRHPPAYPPPRRA